MHLQITISYLGRHVLGFPIRVGDFILAACLLVDDKRGKSEACLDNCIMLGLAHCRLLTLIFVPNAALSLRPSLTRSGILSSHSVCMVNTD